MNEDPAAGVAARSITVPEAKGAEQVEPQLIPAGKLETDPVPVPANETASVNSGTKFAPTVVAAVTGTTQGPVPTHAEPVHPVNANPGAGVALRVTDVPEANVEEHAVDPVPQLIPAGLLVTFPFAVGEILNARVNWGGGGGPKFATTVLAEFMVTAHAPVPVHAPLQPVKAEPAEGLAARLTTAPEPKVAEQAAPQLIPLGRLVTVPEPVPDLLTVRENVGTKVAVTATSEVRATVQVPVPEQAEPLQPAKAEPAAGAAVRVTVAPELNAAVHAAPQLMPAGALVTAPAPLPFTATDRLNWGEGAGPKLATTV